MLQHHSRKIVLLLLLAFFSIVPFASSQKVYTVAGGYVGDGKPATSAGLNSPSFVVYDRRGDLFISDGDNCRIRRVDTAGKISTIVGTGICGFSGDGGKAGNAKINYPAGLAIDTSGNLFFADLDNSRIRKVTSSGTITTIAGSGTAGYCGDGGAAISACLNLPNQIVVAGTGSGEVVLIADQANNRVREVTLKNGKIKTVAGNGTAGYSGDGGPATEASLNGPMGIALNLQAQALLISDTKNNLIRQVNIVNGVISTSIGTQLCSGDMQSLCNPEGLFVDKAGNLYVADTFNSRVVKLPLGNNTFVQEAGTGGAGFNGDGLPATSTLLHDPLDVTLDNSGNLVIVDTGSARVRRGAGSQLVTTLAGGHIGDGGLGTAAALNVPLGVAFDSSGNLLIADTLNYRIRKVTQSDIISTIAGTGITGYSGDDGPATAAELNLPFGVAGDTSGNVYIADTINLAIRKVDLGGAITTFAGNFNPFIIPSGLNVDSSGNVYDADDTCVVWKFTPGGSGTIVAGIQEDCAFGLDGGLATNSALSFPQAVAFDSKGNFYIADQSNNRIQVVNAQGIVNTVAGNGTCGFSGDGGPAQAASLCLPDGIAVDAHDNLYIADSLNFRIRKVDSSGTITTVAGTGAAGYNGEGLSPLRTNMEPEAIVVGPGGVIAFSDASSSRVRVIR